MRSTPSVASRLQGAVLQFLLERDGMERWLAARWPLQTLYCGRDFNGAIDAEKHVMIVATVSTRSLKWGGRRRGMVGIAER